MAQHDAIHRKRWGIFPAKLPLDPDPFWDFMEAHARELESFPYHGSLLLDIELLVPAVLGSDHPLGGALSRITGSSFIAYGPQQAEKALQVLGKGNLSDESIQPLLEEEGRADEFPEIVEPLLQSAGHLHQWLESVPRGHIGLLSIG